MLIKSLIMRAWSALKDEMEKAKAVRHLRQMSDHYLRDIGISRDEIEGFVYGDLCRDPIPVPVPATVQRQRPANRNAPVPHYAKAA